MWQFLNGYVIIQIKGAYVSRLLGRLTASGVRVRNVRKVDAKTVRLTIPVKAFFAIHRLGTGLHLRIRVLSRVGLPFLLRRLRRRPVLWIGIPLLFCGMLILSSRVWIIRIDETKRVDREEILSLLEERGIRPGFRPEGPILITAANDLSAQIKDAAWIGLDREGVMLRVNVIEAIPETSKKTTQVPSDVIAQKDGVVTSVQVMRGQARVKIGDAVKAGDVLISGTVFYKEKGYGTNADGTVKASVCYRSEVELTDTVTESYETDAIETVRVIRIGPWEILRAKPTFEHYRLTDGKTRAIGELLPVLMDTYTAREIGFRERALSEEEAEQNALMLAREQALEQVPRDAAVINIYGTVRTKHGKRFAVVTVTAEETIGRTEEDPHDG